MNHKHSAYCQSVFYIFSCLLLLCTVPAQSSELEEVYIFSRAKQEELKRVPIAVVVADSEAIANVGAKTLNDMEAYFPSLSFGRNTRRTRGELGIRGVSDYSRNIGSNARVAVYIDGVLTGRSSSFDADLSNVSQVEVLSGPQGTLFGANSIAGAINITTRPVSEEQEIILEIDGGNRDYRRASIYANSPVSESINASVFYANSRQNGWMRNIFLNEDMQNLDKQSGMLKFKYAPSDKFSLSWNSDWLSEESNATNGEALEFPASLGGGADRLAPAIREVSHNTDEFEQRDIWGTSLIARYDFDVHQLLSITAYRDVDFDERSEEDYSNSTFLPDIFSLFGESTEQYSQEFKIIKDSDNKLNYVTGLYFLQQRISTKRFASLNGARVNAPGTNRFNSIGVYAQGSYDLSDNVSIELGARLTRENSRLTYKVEDNIGNFGFLDDSIDDKQSITEPSGSLSVNWDINPANFIYVTGSRGFKRGGWNADFVSSLDNIEYEPEYVTSYELGYKASAYENKIEFSLAFFHANYTDFQVFQFIQENNFTSPVLTNAGEATTQGVEWTGRFAISDNLMLATSYAYTDAEFDRFTDADRNGSDFSGNVLPFAPREKYFVSLAHTVTLPAQLELSSYIDYGYQNHFFSSPNNIDANRLSGFHTANLRFTLKRNAWSAAIWVNNVTDEDHLRQQNVSFLGIRRGTYEEPRTYGVSMRYALN